MHMVDYVNLNNAREDSQRRVMQTIIDNAECPFCSENLAKYHTQPILRAGSHWTLTYNQWPYDHTELHLLAIANYHAEHLGDLKEGSFAELQGHFAWAEKKFAIDSGGIAMRFGAISRSGATVRHLHAHLIVPAKNRGTDDKVRFKIG